MPLTRKLQQLADDLSVIDDPQERLSLIMDRSRRIPALPPSQRMAENRISGCVSVVWIVGEFREGRCFFHSDAESLIVRGLVALLCEFYSGFEPSTILAPHPDPLEALGISRNLSPTRRNGLAAARNAIRAFAARHSAGSAAADAAVAPPIAP